MPATIIAFDTFKRDRQNGTINVVSDSLVMLLLSSGFTPDRSTQEVLADIVANEISGNGYGRQTLAGVALSEPTPGTWELDHNPVSFSASGGSIVARYYAIFSDTPVSPADPLICYGLLDDTAGGTDVTVPDGQQLVITPNANGLYRDSGGES